jgi:hypothetical protein
VDRALTRPLFEQVLGSEVFARLAPALRALHSIHERGVFAGRGRIVRGRHPLVALLAWGARLPPTSDDVAVEVTFLVTPEQERWHRRFGIHPMRSRLWRHGTHLREQLGAVKFEFALQAHDSEIHWRVVRVWALGVLPLPARWFDGVRCREREQGGRYEFLVDVALPLIGPLIRYEGWLEPR